MPNPDPDSVSWLRFFLASVTVIGLMGLLAFGLKYTATRGWIVARAKPNRRLKMVENLPLDARRRLVIVQCDGAQHLLLLGVNQDIVVTTNLAAPPATATNTAESA